MVPVRLSKSSEDYLETIRQLCIRNGSAQVRDIAAALNVKMPSVSSAVKLLSELGLVHYIQYAPVKLTEAGEKIADQVISHHVTVREFLLKVLKLDSNRADELACSLEHILLPEEIKRLKDISDSVHLIGDTLTLPTTKLAVNPEYTSLSAGDIGMLYEVDTLSPKLKNTPWVIEHRISPGDVLRIVHKNPNKGPICIQVSGVFFIITHQEATQITLKKGEPISPSSGFLL